MADTKTDRRRRRLRALPLAAAALVAACESSKPEVDHVAEEQLLQQARTQFAAGNFDDAQDAASALIERTKEPARKQEALFLAAETHYADGELVQAFRHYQTLLHDYPYSSFVPRCEEHVYAIGTTFLGDEPWPVFRDLFTKRERGAEVMREFAASFPASGRADDALASIAAYRISRKEYEQAASDYALLARSHPDSEWADLASFRRAECWRLESRGAGYDMLPLQRAARNYRRYLSERPDGAFRERASEELRQVDEMLAESELRKAELYVARESQEGARLHFANVALAFPTTKAAEKARAELNRNGWDLSQNSLDTLTLPPSVEGDE